MKINPTTTEDSLYKDTLYWTGANTATFTIEDFIRSANFAQDIVVSKIFKSNARWKFDDSNNSDRPIGVANLVANQDNYTIDVTHLKINRVRIKTDTGEWKTLTPIDRRDADDDLLNSTGTPEYYDKDGMSLTFYPMADYSYTGGVELEFQRGAVSFTITDTDTEPGFASQFHRLVSLYPAIDWLTSNSTAKNPLTHRINIVNTKIKEMESDLEEYFRNRDKDEAPTMRPKRIIRNNGLSL